MADLAPSALSSPLDTGLGVEHAPELRDLPPSCPRCGSTRPRDRPTVKLFDGTLAACPNARWHAEGRPAMTGMRYFLDTEFIERPGTIDLISIGIVCDDGREFYAESSEVDWSKASPWVLENVRPHLTGPTMPRAEIARQVREFAPPAERPEFWGYYADYDWVVFCWLFGTMMDLPEGYPMYCRDLKQWACDLGVEHLPEQAGVEHHALADARWNWTAWEHLSQNYRPAR